MQVRSVFHSVKYTWTRQPRRQQDLKKYLVAGRRCTETPDPEEEPPDEASQAAGGTKKKPNPEAICVSWTHMEWRRGSACHRLLPSLTVHDCSRAS